MTVNDATHLLLAFLGGSTTKAVERARYISALRFRRFTNDGMSENKAFLDFLGITNNHTFFDLVSSMIEIARVGELVTRIARKVTPSTLPIGYLSIAFDDSKGSVSVRFLFGEYSNSIEYEGVLHGDAEDIFGVLIGDDLRAVADYSYKYSESDLTVSRKITSKTLNKIAEILNR
ncbi:hypothetical protein [Azospirillum sp. TSH58]|uniref:hypothetical protein n=1 Tax=Azospirillum sp. TSH58 TaxID=664962 RepID=UPI0011B1CEB2|nr:hypothetical protein [Azospirillum sp. TSH58]